MSGVTAATVFAGIGAAAAVGSAVYTLTAKGASASGAQQEGQVSASENEALNARSALLETAGGASGSPLAPGQVSNNNNTVFGN